MTRRDLLQLSGVAGATAALARAATPGGVRFGVRGPLPKTSLRDRAELVKSLGYDGIEIGNEFANKPLEFLQKELDGVGLAVSAITGSIGLLDPDPRKRAQAVEVDKHRLQLAKALKAEYVIEVPTFGANKFHDLSPVMTARQVEERLLVAGLRQLTDEIERTGVTLLLEPCNHRETHFMFRQEQAVRTIEEVGSPGIGILTDFYHMQIDEPSIPETLARCGRLTRYVHFADGERRTEPGSLPFDYRPGFRELKRLGYSAWLTIESKATDSPAALERALRYVRQQWQEA